MVVAKYLAILPTVQTIERLSFTEIPKKQTVYKSIILVKPNERISIRILYSACERVFFFFFGRFVRRCTSVSANI